MCSAGQRSREWRFYVTDMIEFGEKILSYTKGIDRATFVADGRTYDATLRNLELIGEAASNVPSHVRATHPEIEWRLIVGVRNRLAHGYLGIDNDIVWDIIQTDIPVLLPALRDLLNMTNENSA